MKFHLMKNNEVLNFTFMLNLNEQSNLEFLCFVVFRGFVLCCLGFCVVFRGFCVAQNILNTFHFKLMQVFNFYLYSSEYYCTDVTPVILQMHLNETGSSKNFSQTSSLQETF